jgi:AraC family transcriptional regulator
MPDERSSGPVQRALWFVENRLSDEMSLNGVAADVGVSPQHLARAFGAATGRSLMNYARGRRLTEAVRRLVDGDASILAVALDHGYASHGAFTRAFRDVFGVTPEAFRRNPAQYALRLTEPVQMDKSKLIDLNPPRFENGERLCIAGLGARYSFEASEGIPDQWRRFGPHIGHVPRQLTPQTYGVAFNFDDAGTFTYVAGVRVRDFSETPGEFATVVIEPRRYAVFNHKGHVIGLHRSHYTIMNDWAPKNELAIAAAPNFELYHPDFDPVTGLGTIEIWMPLDK